MIQGVPFRSAHDQVGRAVAEAEASGVDVADLGPQRLQELLPDLPASAVGGDAVTAVARRDATFGPAPVRVREHLEALRGQIG